MGWLGRGLCSAKREADGSVAETSVTKISDPEEMSPPANRPGVDKHGPDLRKPINSPLARFGLIENATAAEFQSRRLEALHRYWRSRRESGLPQRSDIDPAEIKPLLPYILIVDIHQAPFRVYYRLVGTAVAHFSGMDFTGTYLDELAFDICGTSDLLRAYQSVCETKQPGLGMAYAQITHQSVMDVEYLICPLENAAGEVTQCLVIEDYVSKQGQETGNLRLARQA